MKTLTKALTSLFGFVLFIVGFCIVMVQAVIGVLTFVFGVFVCGSFLFSVVWDLKNNRCGGGEVERRKSIS